MVHKEIPLMPICAADIWRRTIFFYFFIFLFFFLKKKCFYCQLSQHTSVWCGLLHVKFCINRISHLLTCCIIFYVISNKSEKDSQQWFVCRVPSGTWKRGKPGDFNIICPGLEIAWNLSPKNQKTWTKQEILQKTWIKPGMLRYTTFQYYIENFFFQVLYFCDFREPLVSAFWCKNYLQYNLENGFFDLDKTWR